MAHTVKKTLWFLSSNDGVAPEIVKGKIAASQGILIPGAPMYLSTSGTWKAADTCDGTGDVYHGFFVGLDNADSTWPITAAQAANTVIRVAMIRTAHRYAVYAENNGTDCTLGQANVGDQYGLAVSSTSGEVGYTTLDINNANGAVQVVDIMANKEPSKYATTDSPAVAIVQFLNANVDASKA